MTEITGVDLLITLTADEANANNVTIAFTMGTKALAKGHSVEVLLLSDSVRLASNGYADKIDIGAPFQAIKDILPTYFSTGGKMKVCSSCMQHNGVAAEDIIEGAEIVDADYVVDALMAAKKTLQLN